MFQSEFRLSKVEVETQDGGYKISWQGSSQTDTITIYAGTAPDRIDRSNPLAKVAGVSSITLSGLKAHVRHYFEVVPEGGQGVIAAQRRVNLKGAINFRDLGGYETRDGRRVKWGQVYRSDSLSRLTDEDRACLTSLGLKVVCDLRSPVEVENAPDKLPGDGSIEYLPLPVYDGAFDPITAFERIKQGDVSWLNEEFMINGYINNIEHFGSIWGTVIKRLARRDSRPLLWHCTGGKDRAGQCAALVLLALGVPEETVVYDHGLTNVYIADRMAKVYERIEAMGVDPEKVKPWFTAPRSFITNLLDHLRETYGDIETYFQTKTDVDEETIALLRQELLE